MHSIVLFLCRLHVIIQNFQNWGSNERYFPIMFCCFWLNITLQGVTFHVTRLMNYENILYTTNEGKTIIVCVFFTTMILFYLAITNKDKYYQAQQWYMARNNPRALSLVTGYSMLLIFFVMLVTTIYLI